MYALFPAAPGRFVPASLFVCLVFAFVLAAGCGGSEPEGESTAKGAAAGQQAEAPAESQAEETPVTGGRYIAPLLGEPINLISILATDNSSSTVSSDIFTRLLKYNENLEIVPVAAESYQVLEDGKLLKFTLRQDIRWTDGKPLTAADVEFTYNMIVDPKTPSAYQENYKQVQSFTVTGPYSFEIRYEKPLARALSSWMIDILPKHLLEGQDIATTDFSRHPVGAGPYVFKSWTPGSRMVLEANPDYFEGRPYIDQIIYRVIPDQSTQFLELKAGKVDYMGLTPKQYKLQTSGAFWNENFNKYTYLGNGYTYLGYNLKRAMFKDVRVRRALTHAIDRRELVDGVLLGLGRPAAVPYTPGTWVYNDRIKPYAYDPAKAKELLAQVGWTDTDGDGVLDKDGHPFEFTILTNQGNEQRIKTGTIIQQRLAQIGVRVKVRTVEWAAFIQEFVNKGEFDAIILGWSIIPDPDQYAIWHSSKFAPNGLNHTFYSNPEVDDLLEKGRRLLDQKDRKPIYDRVQEILHEDQPYTFLFYQQALPIVHARVRGIKPAPTGIGYNFIRWWIPKDQQRFSLQQ